MREDGVRMLLSLSIVIALAGCTSARQGAAPHEGGIPPSEIGLHKADIDEVTAPVPVPFNDSSPGDRPVLPRSYPGSPPRVPHDISLFTPITRDQNTCLDCHGVQEKTDGGPTPVPRSHYIDLRKGPGTIREAVAGARHNCTTCHVPQTDAPPLVGVAPRD